MTRPPVLIVDPGCFTPDYDRSLAHSLRRAGWDAEVITSQSEFEPLAATPGVRTRLLFPAGLRPDLAPRSRFRRRLERAAGLFVGLLRIDRELARRRPGIVHVQWSHLPLLDRLFWRRWKRAGWRVVYTVHDARPLPGTTPRLLAGEYGRLAASADAVVVHSEAARTELIAMGLGAERLSVIPFALESDTGVAPDRALAKQRLGIAADTSVVLFFGFVKAYKGVAVLLESFALLRGVRSDVTLVVAGEFFGSEGSYRRLATRLGVDHAIGWRPGFVASVDVPTLFAAADVVALPYVAASSSAVLLTAYAFRRPVVASAIGGLVELVDQDLTGVLVSAGDAPALAGALASVLEDHHRAEEMGRRGHARLASHHDWDAAARRLGDLYGTLVG